VLSQSEAARLENWGIWPCCKKSHYHIKKSKALAMVKADTHRFVGGADTRIKTPVSMIVALGEPVMWQPVACRNTDGSALMGMRIWGRPATR
jgi:hypothetical protein